MRAELRSTDCAIVCCSRQCQPHRRRRSWGIMSVLNRILRIFIHAEHYPVSISS
jgi:hypothetical protein